MSNPTDNPGNARRTPGFRDTTQVTTLGRHPHEHHGIVNPPVYRASTVLYPSVEAYQKARTHHGVTYGSAGTPTTYDFEDAVAALEHGHRALALASGKTAVNLTLAALLEAGDHLLMVDTAYGPTRSFCEKTLKRYDVETTFYDPAIGAEIDSLIRPNTRLVFMEAPGSLTFEMQDVPAITAAARARNIISVIDNTWATPLFFKPLDCGVDISIAAATKYLGGHADIMLGVIATNEAVHMHLRQRIYEFGAPAAPDVCWLGLRGLRTLGARMTQHQASGLEIARWLEARPEVRRVMYPALASDPGHELWRRDFKGASSLFGVELEPCPEEALHAMVDGMSLFGIGSSWGGFESLMIVTRPEHSRTAVPWQGHGPTLRLHIGLEDPQDLIADLDAGFTRLRASSAA